MIKLFKNPTFMLVFSVTVFGTIAPIVRFTGLASEEAALYRAVLGCLLIGVVLIFKRNSIPFAAIKKHIVLLLVSGVAIGFNWILLFEAYAHTTVSTATLSYYFAPVIVTLACPILFKEKMSVKSWICFIMSTLGMVLVSGIFDPEGAADYVGVFYGLGAAVLYATVILLNKFIRDVDGISRTFVQFLSAIIVLLPYVAFTEGFHLDGLGSTQWGALLLLGFLHTGITYCMYFSAMTRLTGQKVAVLSYIDPLVAVLISFFVLKENMTLPEWIGGGLILGFTLLNEINLKRRNEK